MRRAALPLPLALALLAVLAGCLGAPVDPGGLTTPPGTAASATDRGTTTTAPATDTGTATAACRAPADPLVEPPDRPAAVNESSARRLATAYETRYTAADIRAEHGNVTVQSLSVRRVNATAVEGGYEVTVTVHARWRSDELTAKGGYPTTYRVTDDRFVRAGEVLACWG